MSNTSNGICECILHEDSQLGNHLFMYFTARIFAEKHHLNLITNLKDDYNILNINKNAVFGKNPNNLKQYKIVDKLYDRDNNEYPYYGNGHYIFDGYFEHEKYLYNNKELILNAISIKYNKSNISSLHIRLGDALLSRRHVVINKKYYLYCIEKYFKDVNEINIVSAKLKSPWEYKYFNKLVDGIQQLGKKIIMKERSFKDDFFFLLNSDKIISSNSTYSFWATFLSKASSIVAFPHMGIDLLPNNTIIPYDSNPIVFKTEQDNLVVENNFSDEIKDYFEGVELFNDLYLSFFKAFYVINDKYKDVTNIVANNFYTDNMITIPKGTKLNEHFEEIEEKDLIININNKFNYKVDNNEVKNTDVLINLSENNFEVDEIIENDKFITEDDIANYCDLCLTRKRNNLLQTHPMNVKEYSIIGLTGYSHVIDAFFKQILPHINKPIILVTIESDIIPIKKEYLENDNIVHWFTWNKPYSHPKLTAIPIGINKDRQLKNLIKYLSLKRNNISKSDKMVLFNCRLNTSSTKERKEIYSKVNTIWKKFIANEEYSFSYEKIINNPSYTDGRIDVQVSNIKTYELLDKYNFILCPKGRGEDTHRTWEALYLNKIPIVLKSEISDLYDNLPVVQLDKWNDLTEELIISKYNEIKNSKYKNDKIYLDYWKSLIESYKNKYGYIIST